VPGAWRKLHDEKRHN